MNENEIKNWCRSYYNLRGNVKIRNINYHLYEFNILLGECECTLPFPTSLKRQLKLNQLGI